MAMIRGIAEIVLSVHDLDASLRFYRETLGLTLVSEPEFLPVFLRAGDPAVTVPQLVVLVPLPAGTSTRCTTTSPSTASPSAPASTPSSPLARCTWMTRTATKLSSSQERNMHQNLIQSRQKYSYQPFRMHPLSTRYLIVCRLRHTNGGISLC